MNNSRIILASVVLVLGTSAYATVANGPSQSFQSAPMTVVPQAPTTNVPQAPTTTSQSASPVTPQHTPSTNNSQPIVMPVTPNTTTPDANTNSGGTDTTKKQNGIVF